MNLFILKIPLFSLDVFFWGAAWQPACAQRCYVQTCASSNSLVLCWASLCVFPKQLKELLTIVFCRLYEVERMVWSVSAERLQWHAWHVRWCNREIPTTLQVSCHALLLALFEAMRLKWSSLMESCVAIVVIEEHPPLYSPRRFE